MQAAKEGVSCTLDGGGHLREWAGAHESSSMRGPWKQHSMHCCTTAGCHLAGAYTVIPARPQTVHSAAATAYQHYPVIPSRFAKQHTSGASSAGKCSRSSSSSGTSAACAANTQQARAHAHASMGSIQQLTRFTGRLPCHALQCMKSKHAAHLASALCSSRRLACQVVALLGCLQAKAGSRQPSPSWMTSQKKQTRRTPSRQASHLASTCFAATQEGSPLLN